MASRRKGREAAVRLLYQQEFRDDTPVEAAESFWNAQPEYDETTREFAVGLVAEVLERNEEIDAAIARASDSWQIERIAHLDRCILRLAVAELLQQAETPAQVIVNEAIEIAKIYCDDDGPRFINGVLDRIARERGLFDQA